jgi:hypothetical protein
MTSMRPAAHVKCFTVAVLARVWDNTGVVIVGG